MQLSPSNAKQRLSFMSSVLAAKSTRGKIDAMMTHRESPVSPQVSSEWRNKIIHARMVVAWLLASESSCSSVRSSMRFRVLPPWVRSC